MYVLFNIQKESSVVVKRRQFLQKRKIEVKFSKERQYLGRSSELSPLISR